MAVKTFYVLATTAVTPNWWGNLQENGAAPTAANTVYGYGVGNTALSTPYFRSRLGASATVNTGAAASNIDALTGPTKGTGATNGTAGDSFVSPSSYSGTFANTAWTFNWTFRSSASGGITGQIRMRVWASVNADGSSPRELTAGAVVGATVTTNNTTDVNSSISWSPGAITLNQEYLFFQLEWQETTLGTSAVLGLFRAGTALITTPDFQVVPLPAVATAVARTTVPSSNLSLASAVATALPGPAAIYLLTEDTSTGPHYAYKDLGLGTLPLGTPVTLSAYFHGGVSGGIILGFSNTTTYSCWSAFNVNTGEILNANYSSTSNNATITDLGNGWFRCTLSATTPAAGVIQLQILRYLVSGSTHDFTGTTGSIYAHNVQYAISNALLSAPLDLASFTPAGGTFAPQSAAGIAPPASSSVSFTLPPAQATAAVGSATRLVTRSLPVAGATAVAADFTPKVSVAVLAATATATAAVAPPTVTSQASTPGAHRYWRINILSSVGGGSSTSVVELEMHTVSGGPSVCDFGTASAQTEFSASYLAAKAFDGVLTSDNRWSSTASGMPQWLKYDFGAGNEQTIIEVALYKLVNSTNGFAPTAFDVQFSDDNAAWTTAWQVKAANTAGWADSSWRNFTGPFQSLAATCTATVGVETPKVASTMASDASVTAIVGSLIAGPSARQQIPAIVLNFDATDNGTAWLVPLYSQLTVTVKGPGGGGGGGAYGANNHFGNPGNPGAGQSRFESATPLIANNGGGGTGAYGGNPTGNNGAAGANGTASGGDINTTGGANNGGIGGTGAKTWTGGYGGDGGLVTKTWDAGEAGAPVPGTTVLLTIRTGGAGGTSPDDGYGTAGGGGSIDITYYAANYAMATARGPTFSIADTLASAIATAKVTPFIYMPRVSAPMALAAPFTSAPSRSLPAATATAAPAAPPLAARFSYALDAVAGVFAATGTSLAMKTARKLAAATGSLVNTGSALVPVAARKLLGPAGAFAATGLALTTVTARQLSGATGLFLATGHAGTVGFGLLEDPGVFTETGQVIAVAFRLTGDPGVFTVMGLPALGPVARQASGDVGSFVSLGFAAVPCIARQLVEPSGLFSATGADTTLRVARKLPAATGNFIKVGANLAHVIQFQLPALNGLFAVQGHLASLDVLATGRYFLQAETGLFIKLGSRLSLVTARKLAGTKGNFAESGYDLGAVWGSSLQLITLSGDTGLFTATPVPAYLKSSLGVSAGHADVYAKARAILNIPSTQRRHPDFLKLGLAMAVARNETFTKLGTHAPTARDYNEMFNFILTRERLDNIRPLTRVELLHAMEDDRELV